MYSYEILGKQISFDFPVDEVVDLLDNIRMIGHLTGYDIDAFYSEGQHYEYGINVGMYVSPFIRIWLGKPDKYVNIIMFLDNDENKKFQRFSINSDDKSKKKRKFSFDAKEFDDIIKRLKRVERFI
ncbi:MAG: hypothetical protein K0R18_207 [Bacillales bacterium]|jgi:hypothetical protein|nr:hypothetical protein [Bacillales bacterium]